jgi:SAM-dependent methyltransferase
MNSKQFYQNKLETETSSIKQVGWDNVEKAVKRYEAIAGMLDPSSKVIVDYGCGNGVFSEYVYPQHNYIGLDRYDEYIQKAKKNYPIIKDSFDVTEGTGVIPKCDEAVVIGVWTLREEENDAMYWSDVMLQLTCMLPSVSKGIIVNGFHNQVGYKDGKLFYHDLNAWIKFLNWLNVGVEIKIFEKHEFMIKILK